jgi:hypothetical protein
MDFNELEQAIPQMAPRIQIGPLSIWVTEFIINNDAYAYSALHTPCLLKTDRIIVFSPKSDIYVYELKKLKEGLVSMYEKTGTEQTFEVNFMESELGLKFTSNTQGHIKIEIKYNSWVEEVDGKLELKDNIDQSYLPEIIRSINSVQLEYKIA